MVDIIIISMTNLFKKIFPCFYKENKGYESFNNLDLEWSEFERRAWEELNKKYRLAPWENNFIPDRNLWKAARERCQSFIDSGVMPNHDDFFEKNAGYLYGLGLFPTGECLANDYDSPKKLITAWSKSNIHHDILRRDFKYVGISRLRYANKTVICLIVGKPKK